MLSIALLALTGPQPSPKYTISLDDEPHDRWKAAVNDTLNRHGWNHSYAPILSFINSVIPFDVWKKHDELLVRVAKPIVGDELSAEVLGVYELAQARGYDDRVTHSQLLFFQVFYEILMQCTGLLARDPASGGLLHGRNMDIGLQVENVTAQVTWTRGGKAVLTTTQYLGYMGVHTGMRLGGWSVQANERPVLAPGPLIGYQGASLLATVKAFEGGAPPIGKFLRDTLLGAAGYEAALPLLSAGPLASPVYLIVGGPQRGTVLTRDRAGPAAESQASRASHALLWLAMPCSALRAGHLLLRPRAARPRAGGQHERPLPRADQLGPVRRPIPRTPA
jgi:hypothetical protein